MNVMLATDGPFDDLDPLAYTPGDRVGLCLDIDGTIYRSGSVFVETLAYLPYTPSITLGQAERRYRRTALLAVAGYHGGPLARLQWRWLLTVLDVLRVCGADSVSESVLTTLARRTADRRRDNPRQPSRPAPTSTSESYQSMRRTVLSAYGRLLAGKRATDVERAATDTVERRCPINPQLHATLGRVTRETETDVYLITDAPEHVATAYARTLCSDAPRVIGTSYETDADGRYTGRFDTVDKGVAVARLRTARGWKFVVAGGDSAVDAAMANAANVFLAVAGEGDVRTWLDGHDGISLRGSAQDIRERLRPHRRVVRVRQEEDIAAALETTLQAVGMLPSPAPPK